MVRVYYLLSLVIMLFLWGSSNAQDLVTGRVDALDAGGALTGVSITKKGSNFGTSTNESGNFSISATKGDVLVFRFLGFQQQEVKIENAKTFLQIKMAFESGNLEEVVITALGRERKTKSLGYSVGEVKSDDLSRVPQENVVNSLTGKVSGLRVINTTPDLNSDPMVIIRGNSSLSGNNSPLIVVDGLPTGTDISVMSDLSADDIESVSVLKGPSAAALYGSRAGSGVLLITTKSGAKGKGFGVSVNSGYSASIPYDFVPLQQDFVTGANGNFNETNNLWWGPTMGTSVARFGTNGQATPLTANPNNNNNFVNVGNSFVNGITLANSNEKLSYSLSLSDTRATGTYPGTDLRKDAISLSVAYKFAENLSISANVNYLNSGSDNERGLSPSDHPYEDLYFTPNWLDVNSIKDYWVDEDIQQSVWSKGFNNPWFTVNEKVSSFRKVRPFGNLKLDWDLTNDLSLMTRIGGFNETNSTENRNALSDKDNIDGKYNFMNRSYQEINTDFLLNYKKTTGLFSFDVSGGGNLFFQNNTVSMVYGNKFVLPGLYTASNIDRSSVNYAVNRYNKRINSLYGVASIGFDDAIYLELTGRNDWSSTLPKENRSYFYPAASLSVVLSDLLTMPKEVSLLKLRGGWAKVGNDTDPYSLLMTLDRSTWADNTSYSLPETMPTKSLLPESIISSELGLDASFLNNRLGLNITYYTVENKNQITDISVSSSTGFLSANVNAGIVKNSGVELTFMAVPIQKKDLRWDLTFNFTKDKTILTALPEGVANHQFWSRTNVFSQTTLNGNVGDLWGVDVLRVPDGEFKGWPLLDKNGYVQNGSGFIKLGNVMPDFTLGLQSNLSIKRITFSTSIDWRQGGDYYSESMKRLTRDGRQQTWYAGDGSSTFSGVLDNNSYDGDNSRLANEIKSNSSKYNGNTGLTYVGGRNGDFGGFDLGGSIHNGVFFPGVISDGSGGYIENFGNANTKYFPIDLIADPGAGYWGKGVQTWVYDASFIKLREFSIAYRMPEKLAQYISSRGVSVSWYVKNLILWTKAKNHIDPESTMRSNKNDFDSRNSYLLGYDRASFYPWTMSTGIKLNIQF